MSHSWTLPVLLTAAATWLHAPAAADDAERKTLTVSEDTYVMKQEPEIIFDGGLRSGRISPMTNYPDAITRIFLKFRLPKSIEGTQITSATLRGTLYGSALGGDQASNPTPHQLHLVATDSWSEYLMNWKNQPTDTQPIDASVMPPPSFSAATPSTWADVNFDITQVTAAEYLGDGVLSLMLEPIPAPDETNNLSFVNKEFGDRAFQLTLTIE
ncbi:DNRLRE domain-containing protein [Myxococcota bacterium]|nr:DNRLRE domain-containing protein [Myxococcota bacterium]